VQNVIDTVYRYCGQKESVIFCDQIMGWASARRSGRHLVRQGRHADPRHQGTIVNATRDQVKEFEQQYHGRPDHPGREVQQGGRRLVEVLGRRGGCDDGEISAAASTTNGAEKEPNSVYMMSHSGARGSPAQMKQLGGMRGLMAKPSGEIIETPIISNFKEGLTVLEYFNSTHGARKGLADTALKTANSGYLTRRLVDVAQDCIVREKIAAPRTGINGARWWTAARSSPPGERILGRVAAEDIIDPATGRDDRRPQRDADRRSATPRRIEAAGRAAVKIRSPLTCEAEEGVCATCYGRDLARGTR
jgi:DNA-directed RNA polymerase subunit beta'